MTRTEITSVCNHFNASGFARERECDKVCTRAQPGYREGMAQAEGVSQHHGQGQDRNSTTPVPQVTRQMGHRARLKYQTWTTRTYQDEYYYIRMSIGCIYILLENGHSFIVVSLQFECKYI